VVSIDHELAPCNLILDQPCHIGNPDSGRPPQQTDDVKNAIRALRADTTRCNGKVGVVGGSSGGSHAVFVALDTTPTGGGGAWPRWFYGGNDDRPDCAVSLSGAYDFPDRTPENYPVPYHDPLPQFNANVENYTGIRNLLAQKQVSPVYVLDPAADFKPLLLINSRYDSMPYHQIVDMICALQEADVDPAKYQTITIPGSSKHSFAYWDDCDGVTDPCKTISEHVIEFLDANL